MDAETEVILANGEPTLYEYFDEILLKVFRSNAKMHVRTNGLLFSNSLYNYLYSDKNSINISVDAGTKETYQKIKRINGFDRVWKNIKKYRETNGDVQVKYVVFSYNSNPKELEAFVEKCLEANIRHVVVSAELNALHNHPNCPWEFGEREYKAIFYLNALCKKHNIHISSELYLSVEQQVKRYQVLKDMMGSDDWQI